MAAPFRHMLLSSALLYSGGFPWQRDGSCWLGNLLEKICMHSKSALFLHYTWHSFSKYSLKTIFTRITCSVFLKCRFLIPIPALLNLNLLVLKSRRFLCTLFFKNLILSSVFKLFKQWPRVRNLLNKTIFIPIRALCSCIQFEFFIQFAVTQ